MRTRRALASFAALGLGLGVVGTARSEAQTPAAVRYIEPVFDEVERTEDVPYREAENVDGELQTLALDIYEPVGDTAEQRPVIMLIHGGFFVFGNHKSDQWGAGPAFAQPFVERGYVVVSVQYRLRPDMGLFPDVDLAELEAAGLDAYDDSAAAVAWLQDHAEELRIDPEAIVALGPSAGGAIAWSLAWMQGSTARPDPSGVPAAISVSGAPFPVSVTTGEPLVAPSPGDVPVLAIHGTEDAIVGFDLAAEPCSQAAAAGVRCDLVPLEGVGHPGIDPAFLDHLDDIIDREIRFLAEVVLLPMGYIDELPAEPPAPTPAPPARPIARQPDFTG